MNTIGSMPDFRVGEILNDLDGIRMYVVGVTRENDLSTTLTLTPLSRWKLFRWFQIKWYNLIYKKTELNK